MKALHHEQIRREERRIIALRLYDRFLSQAYVADLVGVSPGAMSQWVKARTSGKGVKATPKTGRKSRMTPAQWRAIVKATTGKGYTLVEISHMIEAAYGHDFHPRYLERPLRKYGYRK